MGQSLATWIIGSEVSSAEEVAKREALDLRYLKPTVFTLDGYKARLEKQARGVPVPPINGVPVVKTAEESTSDEDDSFVKWVHKTRRLANIYALRNGTDVADVRLERKLRYEFAKLRAKGRSRASRPSRYASATSVATTPGQTLTREPSNHTTIGGKRSGSKAHLDRDVRKRPRRTGNLFRLAISSAELASDPMIQVASD